MIIYKKKNIQILIIYINLIIWLFMDWFVQIINI